MKRLLHKILHRKKLVLTVVSVLFLGLIWWWFFSIPKVLFEAPCSSVVYDQAGALLAARIADDEQYRFPLNQEVPQKFATCITAFEDRSFYDHSGVNWGSLFRALRQNIDQGEIVSGASTISMQVIRLSRNNPKRSYLEKALEILRALRLEVRYSKAEILAFYASNAPIGGNVVGLDAAAWRYYGRSANELSWSETAALAVLPNAPGVIYPGRSELPFKEKRDRLLAYLHEEGHFDELDFELAKAEALPSRPKALPRKAMHLMNSLEQQYGRGKSYKTSIDKYWQEQITAIATQHVQTLESNHIYNAAVLVTKISTGEVVAYVGNVSGDGHGRAVDIIHAQRSTGSILKPLLFASMIDEGELLPHELVKDIPTNINGYQPENYTKTYMGAVPASEALVRSLNVPAVRMLREHGLEKFHIQLQDLGFEQLNKPSSHYGLSLILGGGETTLWELNRCYGGLARSLKYFTENSSTYPDYFINDLNILSSSEAKHFGRKGSKPLSAASVYQMLEVMKGVNRPESELGWEYFSGSRPVAWKTGTSFGHRDAWALGITGEYVISVWVGNASGEGRPGLTGARAAGPILFQVVDLLPKSSWFSIPWDELNEIESCEKSGERLGPHCEASKLILIGEAGLRKTACSHHQLVFLDEAKQHRVNRSCYSGEIIKENKFELSPAEAWYYRKHHPEYSPLPPWHPACLEGVEQQNIQMIYPKDNDVISIPINVAGEQEQVVLEAAHAQGESSLYWHLDQTYLGSTKLFHQMTISPLPGTYTLVLSDDFGEVLTQKITIVGAVR